MCLLVGLIVACSCVGIQQPVWPFPGAEPGTGTSNARKDECFDKYIGGANPIQPRVDASFCFRPSTANPPGPLVPSMFHVSTGCSPTIANVEAAQFERSCTKLLIAHQAGCNAQVPLLDHVSVSHKAIQPLQPAGHEDVHGTEARGLFAS